MKTEEESTNIMKERAQRLRYFINIVFDGNNADLARSIGISAQALSSYLTGKRNFGIHLIERLWKLGSDTNWLLYGDGQMFANNANGHQLKTQFLERAEAYFKLTPSKPAQPAKKMDEGEIEELTELITRNTIRQLVKAGKILDM